MKSLFRYAARGVGLAALGLMIPFTSHAFLITADTIDEEFTVEFLLAAGEEDGNENLNPVTGQDLSAMVIFTHLDWDGAANTLSLQVDVTNSSANDGNNVGLWHLAFGMAPTATGVTLTHISGVNIFNTAAVEISPPAISNAVVGLSADGGQASTSPGYPNTLNEGMQNIFQLDFTFSSIGTGVEFSPFGSFWQTAYDESIDNYEGPTSFQFGGEDTTTPVGPPPTPVPEPATLGLLGLGMLAMGALRRRKVALKR